jgi:deoxyribonuclease V
VQARDPHPWPESKLDANRLQEEAAGQVRLIPLAKEPHLIGAVETVYGSSGDMLYGCGVIMTFPELEEVERVFAQGPPGFPYVPGMLYFREGEVVAQLLSNFVKTPDLIIVHGHGTAHQRRCGLASHIGVVFDVPTLGCCRRLLSGRHRDLPETKGASQPIILGTRQVGVAYRSKDRVKPIFISPGHLCDQPDALTIVQRCLRGFRQPEPLRLAHRMANKHKRRCEKKHRSGNEPLEKSA